MQGILRKYAAFIRQPDVARLLLVGLVSRLPIGMVGFSMLVFLREMLGNFADAGAAVGIDFLACAAVAPMVGRIVDRKGPRRVLYVTGVMQPLSLAATLLAARHGMSFGVIAFCAALSGLFSTPTTTLTRTMWRHRFDREEDRRTAFALDSVTIEINFTLGPALMAAILAGYGSTAAFACAIVAVVVALLVFMASPALKYFHPGDGAGRHLLGPLTEPRLWLIYATTFGLTVCLGLMEVGYPAYGAWLAAPALGGIFLGVNSLGSAVGGSLYGGLHFRSPVERQFAWAMGLMALPLLLHAALTPVALFAVVAFLAGALIAPSIAAQSVLVSRLAPPRYATEAFTWSSTCIISGLGVGMALGGWLVETSGIRSVFITAAALAAAMALAALTINAAHPAAAGAET
ncbi:MAG TPA: MFS transporter [Usitatibacter sp.]|nr:MFS transporter [Usitatibacter sp.]